MIDIDLMFPRPPCLYWNDIQSVTITFDRVVRPGRQRAVFTLKLADGGDEITTTLTGHFTLMRACFLGITKLKKLFHEMKARAERL